MTCNAYQEYDPSSLESLPLIWRKGLFTDIVLAG
jgi:hypothetical protein